MITKRPSVSVLVWSLAISLLATLASVVGLVDPAVYAQETANWTLQAKGQDVGNLLAVVVLLVSAARYRGGSFQAGLIWLGTLLYLIYAFVIYAMAVHLNALFLVYVAVLGLASYAAIFAVNRLRLVDAVFPQGARLRFAAWVLAGIGALFGLLWLSELVPALLTGQVPASLREAGLVVNPVHALDLSVVLPGVILTGVAALRGRDYGRFWIAPWLAFSSLMGASIVAAMALMMAAGYPASPVPLVMLTIVVAVSGWALWRYLAGIAAPATDLRTLARA